MPALTETVYATNGAGLEGPPSRIHASVMSQKGEPINGVVEEMSPVDLRLFLDQPLRMGMLVNVRLNPEGWNSHFETCGVVHRSELMGGGADIGIFLSEHLSEELVAACWLEMRRELRYPVIWSVWAKSEAQKKIVPATVLNYSYSGAQLRMAHAARPGETMTLMNDDPITTATVSWAAPLAGNDFMCGCEMAKSDGLKLALRIQMPSASRSRRG